MSNRLIFYTTPPPHPARSLACLAIQKAPDGYRVTIEAPRRSTAANDLMWAVLTQLEPIDWHGFKLTKEEWKDVITASLKRQKAVPGIDGGFVVLGARTSKMSGAEISEVIEAAYALGASKGITFTEVA